MNIALVGAECEENLALGYIRAALEARGHHVTQITFNAKADTETAAECLARSGVGLAGFVPYWAELHSEGAKVCFLGPIDCAALALQDGARVPHKSVIRSSRPTMFFVASWPPGFGLISSERFISCNIRYYRRTLILKCYLATCHPCWNPANAGKALPDLP
jgi:hypothetical protein